MGVSWNFYFLTNLERFVLTDNGKFYGRTLLQHLGVLLFRHIFDFAHPSRNESMPIQLAQCWFPRLAISNAKM